MPKIPTLLEMLQVGLHFGHQVSKRHPKMEPYIFGQKSKVHIIDLEITQQKLKEALEFVKKIVSNGGTVLFLGAKQQAKAIIKEAAESCQMPYIVERWLGGTFTNFFEIRRLMNHYLDLVKKKGSGKLEKYTKKERLKFDEEIKKLAGIVGGIVNLTKLPDAIFIADVKNEKTALREAIKKRVPIIGVCDTNVNPEDINYVIPANDDAIKSIKLIADLVAAAVKEGQMEKNKKAEKKIEEDK